MGTIYDKFNLDNYTTTQVRYRAQDTYAQETEIKRRTGVAILELENKIAQGGGGGGGGSIPSGDYVPKGGYQGSGQDLYNLANGKLSPSGSTIKSLLEGLPNGSKLLQSAVQGLPEQLSKISEIDNLKSKLSTAESKISTLESKVNTLESYINQLKALLVLTTGNVKVNGSLSATGDITQL